MLVDLGRNDVGRVCEYGSVRVPQFMGLERYSHVMHLVSIVEGRLADGLRSPRRAGRRASRPGTVSGAPKVRAMEIIAELEPDRRGIYAGRGRLPRLRGQPRFLHRHPHDRHVRTARRYVQAGAGIVADSNPAAEYEETRDKARALMRALELAQSERAVADAHDPGHRQLRFVHLQPRAVPRRARGASWWCAATTDHARRDRARCAPTAS